MSTLVVVDAANVIGSVPDGWWRDRRAAAERLRDALAEQAADGLPGLAPDGPPARLVLVVEGAARGVASLPGVGVVEAPGSGDDRIVELVRDADRGPDTVVVTADRGLRARVTALGARVAGPRAVRRGRSG
ncbi:NTP pyrophosphohydrolase [Streptomyces rimosus subsp. pseudoverticillatus]|uniref:NTP pyrophosphohydrolase n=1 Tax=Streptomyces rimosus TaxID=1927 RepID=UPI0006B2A7BE|nr:NTP pyrophosphohydrolase [Streptomyces rimosus]KOT92870.1 NTP pyrophosphohydrolase [Streptomyces rimosus subsp. pseudoverticillatus]